LLDGVPFCHRNENCLKRIKKKLHNYRIILGIYKRSIGNHFKDNRIYCIFVFGTINPWFDVCKLILQTKKREPVNCYLWPSNHRLMYANSINSVLMKLTHVSLIKYLFQGIMYIFVWLHLYLMTSIMKLMQCFFLTSSNQNGCYILTFIPLYYLKVRCTLMICF
jgi:hypothetical protein